MKNYLEHYIDYVDRLVIKSMKELADISSFVVPQKIIDDGNYDDLLAQLSQKYQIKEFDSGAPLFSRSSSDRTIQIDVYEFAKKINIERAYPKMDTCINDPEMDMSFLSKSCQ